MQLSIGNETCIVLFELLLFLRVKRIEKNSARTESLIQKLKSLRLTLLAKEDLSPVKKVNPAKKIPGKMELFVILKNQFYLTPGALTSFYIILQC